MVEKQFFVKSLHFSENIVSLDANIIGQKAVGLFNIPKELTPPFLVLTTSLYNEWLLNPTNAKSILKDILYECVEIFDTHEIRNFILRSSAVNESFEERGLYESSEGNIDKNKLFESVIDLWNRNKDLIPIDGFALIIQQHIDPKILGHLSNERRISDRSQKWLYEIENLESENVSKYFIVNKEINSIPNYQCKNRKLLKEALFRVASYWQTWKYSPTNRYHLEWIWDKNRLWIVQNDMENNSKMGSAPGSEWGVHLTDITQTHSLTCFNTIDNVKSDWKKINCVRTFAECSLPYGNVYILEDESLIDKLVKNNIPETLLHDLAWLLQTPIVIRMDVQDSDNVLLPRTETLFTVEDATNFLVSYSKEFREKGEFNKFCFLVHRFIISKSCALAFSRPSSSKVRIDSTWGIVDGLHYYPHDSFEVDYKRDVRKKVRCKTEYIDVNDKGKWYPRISGTEWDWQDSLTQEQIDNIAKYSLAICNHLGKAVTVMYFVDVNPKTGYLSTIPWFYSTDELLSTSNDQLKDIVFYPDKILVQDAKSFDSLRKKVALSSKNRMTIKLKLNVDSVRNKSLVEEIGIFAHDNNISVELEGSMLAHTYYILKKQNAKVRTINQFDHKSEKKTFNKLVRDKIPENIKAKGETVKVKTLPEDLKLSFLKRKAVEEAYELFWERNSNKEIEELADLFEVIRSICKEIDLSLDDLKKIADLKNSEKGSFDKGLFLFETEDPSLVNERKFPQQLSLFSQESHNFSRKKIDQQQGIFSIPYIPQVDMNSNKLTRFIHNQNLEILYTENGIRIKILSQQKDPNQLNIFNV